ncbi:MAG: cytochrome c biogenesis protein CcdA [Thermoplasmata archaeon]|nr:cytochrome c biogenesis protein CcdA [Thermoplasmata archaeon]
MRTTDKMMLNKTIVLMLALSMAFVSVSAIAVMTVSAQEELPFAGDFTVTDHLNRTFSLNDLSGDIIILHITQLENPLCIECEEQMNHQIMELASLATSNEQNISIVTLNIRKNEYSDPGWELAESWYDVNITWHWVEEFEPYSASSLYQNYWEMNGSFSNPSIILIDQELRVAGVYHVYCIGVGELDGVQTADSLAKDASDIMYGDWGEFRGHTSDGVTLAGMFALGIITSISPCSIALLIVMISYIGSIDDGSQTPRDTRKKGLKIGIAFTLGMTLMFFLIGLLVSYVGLFIEMSAAFYLIAGIILAILGINAIKPLGLGELASRLGGSKSSDGELQSKDRFIDKISSQSEFLGSFMLGMFFTVGWAPCAISLVFPVIVMMLTQDFTLLTGGIMMAAFGLGHGLIIVPICTATGDVKGRLGNKLVKAGKWVQPGFGIVIVILGVIFALRFFGFNLW